MRRLLLSLLGILALLAGAVLAAAAPAGAAITANRAPAAAATVIGGRTAVVIAPATTDTLLQNDILPVPIAPGRVRPSFSGGFTVATSFPVTGGAVDISSVTGTINHAGGLLFFDLHTFRGLAIEDFDINLGPSPTLTAWVPALGARATIFDLSLAGAHIQTPDHRVLVTGVGVTLDPGGAAALNTALGTSVFVGGLTIGTAATSVRVAG